MADYINREELENKIYNLINPDFSDVMQTIYSQPSADVVEVDETKKRTIAKYLDIITNEKQCVLIASQNQCDRNCANCQLLRNTSDILETYDYVLKMLKNVQELKKDINVLNKEVTK